MPEALRGAECWDASLLSEAAGLSFLSYDGSYISNEVANHRAKTHSLVGEHSPAPKARLPVRFGIESEVPRNGACCCCGFRDHPGKKVHRSLRIEMCHGSLRAALKASDFVVSRTSLAKEPFCRPLLVR